MAYLLSDGATTVVTYPYTIGMLRRDNPSVSFPAAPSEADLANWNVFPLVTTTPTAYDPLTESRAEGVPLYDAGTDSWQQTWVVTELTAEEQTTALAVFIAQTNANAANLIEQADQYVVKAIVDGVGLTVEFQAYRQDLLSPENLPGYPAETVFPDLPVDIFDPNATPPMDAYTKAEVDQLIGSNINEDVADKVFRAIIMTYSIPGSYPDKVAAVDSAVSTFGVNGDYTQMYDHAVGILTT